MRHPLLSPSSLAAAAWTARGLAVAALLATANAWAQPTANEHDAADVTMARQLGNEGLELAGAGNCAAAVDPLSRSEAMHHAPTTLDILGECHISLGKLVQGAEELTRVVRENIDPLAPASFRTAQDRARTHLEDTRPRIPKLRLVVTGAASSAALTVRFDGEPIPVASLGLDRPVDPGHHRVEVSANGYKQASGEVTLQEGETQALSLELVRLPETESAASTTLEGASDKTAAAHAPRSRTPAYVAFGIGAAGIATGSVFGMVTLSKTASLDRLCPTRSTCPASAQSEIDTSKRTALTSSIAYGIGGAALLVGLYFAVVSHGSEPAAMTGKAVSNPTLRPWIDLGSAGFDGSF
jgi:hypothetical protein